jgi:hypothetical protein
MTKKRPRPREELDETAKSELGAMSSVATPETARVTRSRTIPATVAIPSGTRSSVRLRIKRAKIEGGTDLFTVSRFSSWCWWLLIYAARPEMRPTTLRRLDVDWT